MRFKTAPRKAYPSDLTDEQWSLLASLLPSDRTDRLGRPREVDLREGRQRDSVYQSQRLPVGHAAARLIPTTEIACAPCA
jgi:transposase